MEIKRWCFISDWFPYQSDCFTYKLILKCNFIKGIFEKCLRGHWHLINSLRLKFVLFYKRVIILCKKYIWKFELFNVGAFFVSNSGAVKIDQWDHSFLAWQMFCLDILTKKTWSVQFSLYLVYFINCSPRSSFEESFGDFVDGMVIIMSRRILLPFLGGSNLTNKIILQCNYVSAMFRIFLTESYILEFKPRIYISWFIFILCRWIMFEVCPVLDFGFSPIFRLLHLNGFFGIP